jgi:hypothetical protein
MSKKLSKEQWAMARVYSFINGNPKHDNDLRLKGGVKTAENLQNLSEEIESLLWELVHRFQRDFTVDEFRDAMDQITAILTDDDMDIEEKENELEDMLGEIQWQYERLQEREIEDEEDEEDDEEEEEDDDMEEDEKGDRDDDFETPSKKARIGKGAYRITPYTKQRAKELGVQVKPSTNPEKKVDVYKDGDKIASIGAIDYSDFPTYLKNKGRTYAEFRRKLYHLRHKNNQGVSGYYAKNLLW